MTRPILCADDYGLAPGVSRAIARLLAAGRLSATSCITVTRFWPEQAAALRPFADTAEIGRAQACQGPGRGADRCRSAAPTGADRRAPRQVARGLRHGLCQPALAGDRFLAAQPVQPLLLRALQPLLGHPSAAGGGRFPPARPQGGRGSQRHARAGALHEGPVRLGRLPPDRRGLRSGRAPGRGHHLVARPPHGLRRRRPGQLQHLPAGRRRLPRRHPRRAFAAARHVLRRTHSGLGRGCPGLCLGDGRGAAAGQHPVAHPGPVRRLSRPRLCRGEGAAALHRQRAPRVHTMGGFGEAEDSLSNPSRRGHRAALPDAGAGSRPASDAPPAARAPSPAASGDP